ncbi:MMPL family transporter [Zafaria sp. J156]|uniref:MMPL family transporter n=1 Tax=Zafaria sp. J156 TaxID=3116490 RepID=UPI002E7A533B|nr:MMPL family transporter [Zafaria sp. J156]MEE1619988.1 MMPL family transporter [Zafaria sp. J156]
MATFLYRIGRLAYRRRWWFVAVWATLLLGVGAAAGAFMGTLSNTFTIPGTETQRTLDRLKDELPEAAGGTGSIVYRTLDGTAFTAEQERAVSDALAELERLEDVSQVNDPFEAQRQLDEAAPAVEEARQQLADGQAELEDGRAQLEDGRIQLAEGRTEIEDGRTRLAEGRAELEDGRAQLEAGRAELAQGRAELGSARAELNDGQARLDAGKAEIAQGQRQYDAGARQIADGRSQLAAGERQLASSESRLKQGRAGFEAGVAELTGGLGVDTLTEVPGAIQEQRQFLDDSEAALDAEQAALEEQKAALEDAGLPVPPALEAGLEQIAAARAELASGRAALDQAHAGQQELTAAGRQLDAGEKELAAGRATLAEKKKELDAGAAELAAAKRKLDAGRAEIAANERRLAAGWSELAQGQAKLDAGAAEIAANEETLAAGEREIEENAAKLAAGEARLDAEEAKLPDAERQLGEGEAELADGRAQLALGERQAASTQGMRFVSEDGSTAAVHVTFTGQADALTADVREEIQRVAGAPSAVGVEALYSKEIVQDISEVFGVAEIIGIAIAAVVLLVMLGTLIAAGLPLVMAVLGVAIGAGGTLALSSVVDMASITPALALMLGLAVGIDYSLFIVHRHRRQLLDGMEMQESIGRANGTSGNAVVFAGLTVIIALAALAVPGLPFLTVLGLSAAFTVAVAVAIATTLTPALLAIIGTRLISKRAWAKAAAPGAAASRHQNDDGARGWGALVTRRPVVSAVAGTLLLLLVALPALGLRTALPDGSAEAEGSSALAAYETISETFGGGYNGPMLVLADLPAGLDEDGATHAALDVADELREIDGIVAAVPGLFNEDHTLAVLQLIPEEGPASEATEQLVHTIRDAAGAIEESTGAQIALTGQVAAQIDVSEKLASVLPAYLGIVIGLSLVLLLLVFRSVVVPLLATAGFLLSLAAAFGATVAVYQWGWLGGVFNVHTPGPIMSFLPILLTGILFGLAMDYQVFLVSGMRESFAHGEDPRAAVRSGFSHAAPVVTAAALIMTSVFAGFVFSHLTMIRPIGFALAVGVLVDAFVVRMTITPAVMHLLGAKAWYIPRWLDRILPDVDVEGAKLSAVGPAASGPRGDGGPGGDGGPDGDSDGGNDWFPFDEESATPAHGTARVQA